MWMLYSVMSLRALTGFFFSKISPFAFSYDRKHHSISSISEGFFYPNKDKNIRFLCNTFIMSSLHVQNSSDVQI